MKKFVIILNVIALLTFLFEVSIVDLNALSHAVSNGNIREAPSDSINVIGGADEPTTIYLVDTGLGPEVFYMRLLIGLTFCTTFIYLIRSQKKPKNTKELVEPGTGADKSNAG